MTIPKTQIDEWKELQTADDCAKIAGLADVHEETVRRVLRDGETKNFDLFLKIKEYYKQKKELINSAE